MRWKAPAHLNDEFQLLPKASPRDESTGAIRQKD